MLRTVRFAHPWTDPETGASYTPGQVGQIDSGVASNLVYAGEAVYADGQAVTALPGGLLIDSKTLADTLQAFEPKIVRDDIAPGRVVVVRADGKLGFASIDLSGGSGTLPAATTSSPGAVYLRGDLTGSADTPRVVGLSDLLDLGEVQQAIRDLIVAGSGISVTPDSSGRLVLSASGSGGGGSNPGGSNPSGGNPDSTYSATYSATY